jgi:hypothetical protein
MRTPGRFVRLVFLSTALALACGWSSPAPARVEVTLDAPTLTAFLETVTPPTVILPLPSGKEIAMELRGLRVNGFDPAGGKNGKGLVLTSLRLAIPALGIELPLEPKLALDVVTEDGIKNCVLRFEKLSIPLPLTGTLDVSPLLPTFRVPTDAEWVIPMRQGDVGVKSRLVETRMGSEAIRFAFDLDMAKGK